MERVYIEKERSLIQLDWVDWFVFIFLAGAIIYFESVPGAVLYLSLMYLKVNSKRSNE